MIRPIAASLFCLVLTAVPVVAAAQNFVGEKAAGGPTSAAPGGSSSPPNATLRSAPAVSGVTVTKRQKCKDNDKACIAAVTKQAWAHYPDQMKRFCINAEARVARDGFQASQQGFASLQIDHSLSPPRRALCDYGDRAAKPVS